MLFGRSLRKFIEGDLETTKPKPRGEGVHMAEIPEQNFFVESIYGIKTKQGIVQIQWEDFKTQMSVLEAKKIAHMILEAAHFAMVDEAIFNFFNSLPGEDSMQLAAMVIKAIRDSQGRNDPRLFET